MDIKKFFKSRIVQAVGTAVLFFGAGLLVSAVAIQSGNGTVTSAPLNLELTADARTGFNNISNVQAAFRQISRTILPAVVEIDVVDVVTQNVPAFQSPFDNFFGTPDALQPRQRQFRRQGLGSGVMVRQVGDRVYVLTNNHVVDGANEITVVLPDKRTFKATVTGKDDRRDLALVSFTAAGAFPTAALGNSDTVEVGDWVLAVGNPLGFDSTVTQGIISAVGRQLQPGSDISPLNQYFQTDAAVNQGNSGGALVNINGEVIGINTWIASTSGGSVGLGFAIPINGAKKAIEDFITKGRVSYGWLGITGGDIGDDVKTDLGLAGKSGAFVYDVYRNSPAGAAGIFPGDYIIKVDGRDIPDMTQLVLAIGSMPAGARATFTVVRQGALKDLAAVVYEKPADSAVGAAGLWPGLAVVKISADIRGRLRLPASVGGFVVSRVESGGAAESAGFKPGDIVQSIGGRTANSLRDFYAAVNSGNRQSFRIVRDSSDITLTLGR
jgi:serine protease Do